MEHTFIFIVLLAVLLGMRCGRQPQEQQKEQQQEIKECKCDEGGPKNEI